MPQYLGNNDKEEPIVQVECDSSLLQSSTWEAEVGRQTKSSEANLGYKDSSIQYYTTV